MRLHRFQACGSPSLPLLPGHLRKSGSQNRCELIDVTLIEQSSMARIDDSRDRLKDAPRKVLGISSRYSLSYFGPRLAQQ